MNLLTNIAAVCAVFGGLVFMITYHRLAPWRRSTIGINQMGFVAAMTLLVSLRIMAIIVGDAGMADAPDQYWGQSLLRLFVYTAVAVLIWHRWLILLDAQLGESRHLSERQTHAPPTA